MKHPCKSCLVRPTCNEDCKKYKQFVEIWSKLMPIIGLFTSCLILFPLFVFMNTWEEPTSINTLFVIFWVVCMFYTIARTELDMESIGIIVIVLFAPILATTIFIIRRTKKWFLKYNVRA